MAEAAARVPVTSEKKQIGAWAPWRGWEAMDSLHREIDRLFEDLPSRAWPAPFRRRPLDVESVWSRDWGLGAAPAVDIVEKDNTYEITAELPGIDEKNVELKYADGILTIKGEKEETREEKKKEYHLSERRYGSFQRSFSVPAGIDADRIAATFSKGVLTISLPKSAEAQKKEKKIPVAAK